MRHVVVTGGGTGIGRAVAARFARDGDRVVVLGRRPDVLAEAASAIGARAVECDVADPAAVDAVLPRLPSRVDVLVNAAGGNTDFQRPADRGDGGLAAVARDWWANLRSNVLSAVLVTEALTPRLNVDGRVVTIGSIAARTGAGSYGAAKAAVEAWTADLATALGRRGITANVVAPGFTEDTEFFRGRLSDERAGQLVEATATGRAGTPADVAGVVHFLASPDAGHLTGQVVHVNGGAYLGR